MKSRLRLVILSLLIFNAVSLYGQSGIPGLILTKEQNDKWIADVKMSPMKKQLELIRDRILLDTNVYVPAIFPDRINLHENMQAEKKAMSYRRPLLVFNDIFYPSIDSKTKSKSVAQLANFLTEENIKDVTVINDTKSTALFGAMADGGVILLTTRSRKVFR